MKLKKYLTELATTKIDIYDKGKSKTHWYIYFKTPSGAKYLVNALKFSPVTNNYIFTFQLLDSEDDEIGYMKNVHLKDKKEVFAVFSGVAQAFDIFVKEMKPDIISIEANEARKTALYSKFIDHVTRKYPYRAEEEERGHWRLYKE
jgi:hypothetical protein